MIPAPGQSPYALTAENHPMPTFTLLYVLHLLAALAWVGGMFFAWMILRPAAVAVLQRPVLAAEGRPRTVGRGAA